MTAFLRQPKPSFEAPGSRNNLTDPGTWWQQRFREAEPLLLRSYSIIRDEWGDANRRSRNASDRIVDLYHAWGRPEKAAEWRAKLGLSGPSARARATQPWKQLESPDALTFVAGVTLRFTFRVRSMTAVGSNRTSTLRTRTISLAAASPTRMRPGSPLGRL